MSATTGALMRWNDLTVGVGGRRLFSIPELTLYPESCTVLTGSNGAGKSTLLRTLAGLVRPLSGRLCSGPGGSSLGPWRAPRWVRRRVIYMHQHPYLFDASVLDNVAYGLRRAGLARAECRRQAHAALEWAGIGALAARDARALSGGERQKVALTRARILRPRMLLLDEPTASLDPDSRDHTYALLRRLAEEGVGIVVASHEVERSLHIADSRWHIDHGHFVSAGIVRPKTQAVPVLMAAQ